LRRRAGPVDVPGRRAARGGGRLHHRLGPPAPGGPHVRPAPRDRRRGRRAGV
ncbi:MAG: hypothetical protein AVDCRST_MAG24-750, partial [uncultured Nocardioidaceae bacterium]